MIRLNLSTAPRWIDLLPGLRLEVAPVTTAIMASARSDASLDNLDPDAPKEVLAVAMAKAVARQVVTGWEGVGDDAGDPVGVTPEGIDALLDIWPVFEAFQAEVLGPHLVLDSEKNGSALSPNGTSAGATDTANPAPDDVLTAHSA
ncbi:hypothetical protein SAMN04489859_103923 [Paracoccus alcaliphilus]|uniref:Uncharacterized protein n=1 Tax=Paracoccus alcaliphilus TaxID=34002 RepID=A0A1H8ME62_9RHOB|nr:hypothetical protein [Paracoccus alcaliphilus]WCR18655.1 hypothetical protein JHW40_02605 [Paracoccus alcaliphilus]SEO15619.1 hypothetical protein SAMN04489859_103923 [Paracoccus alcaliphilus]